MTTSIAPRSTVSPNISRPRSKRQVVSPVAVHVAPVEVVSPMKRALGLVVITTVLLFLFAFVVTWWASADAMGALGVAAFSALWGGPGFGVMVAGAAWFQGQTEA